MRLTDGTPERSRERTGGGRRGWAWALSGSATALVLVGVVLGSGVLIGVGLVLTGVAAHLFGR